ncbi:dual specificity protein phosphatase MPK-4 isoform X2 [Megalopta genalis]|nr:dual specificity protein phosphatase MPK-4 isoform X2 [Megalopta genalis]XP_033321782.1 dual specificity protein phosphatase MPK-4 isoform X2 [Megalopta genalis]
MTDMAEKADHKLCREDFTPGPASYSEVYPGLYLGNLSAATDIEWLREAKIDYILTVDSCPIPRQIPELLPNLTIKYIQITDMPREDLLTHFGISYEFINHALESNSRILVHCYLGVSRSATLVIAYLMKKYRKSYCDTFEIVREKRPMIGPNRGFVAQLKLYEDMDFEIDSTSIRFKMYRLQIAADKVRKAKILPQDCMDLVRPDPALATVRPEPTVYRCKKCRRIVASASNILPHAPREKQIWRHISTKRTSKQSKAVHEPLELPKKDEHEPVEFCTKILFVEPMAWMPDITHNVEGKLNCPKCSAKLGSFSWIAGNQCPCGSKIAPAFYLVPSKVDWSNAVQNVQVTV